ncbi:MAG: hypothetical protein J6P05_01720 [Lachnospiraceae bacterium]|nr:hypothetical protein [Lachnospiraceae bacterium]
MRQSFEKIKFLIGSAESLERMAEVPSKTPFDDEICEFLNSLSKALLTSPKNRMYPAVTAFGFFLRKGSIGLLKQRFLKAGEYRLGRGMSFHIAPSNVPVNFAYSLAAGLLAGNPNVVRVPSKEFPEIDLIAEAMRATLEAYEGLKNMISLVRYERDREINDDLSGLCANRIIWGGDSTIEEIRKSPLAPRAKEICFADRYSFAVIDTKAYLDMDPKRVAESFYNDTYLSDQNACSSPRVICWTGNEEAYAKKLFWDSLHEFLKQKFELQSVKAVDKLSSLCLVGASFPEAKPRFVAMQDNLITRVELKKLPMGLMQRLENSGFFFEYSFMDILELKTLCLDKRCQTIGYIGDKRMFMPLLASGIGGVDRIVPIGKTMDFDLYWDGYDLINELSRNISVS